MTLSLQNSVISLKLVLTSFPRGAPSCQSSVQQISLRSHKGRGCNPRAMFAFCSNQDTGLASNIAELKREPIVCNYHKNQRDREEGREFLHRMTTPLQYLDHSIWGRFETLEIGPTIENKSPERTEFAPRLCLSAFCLRVTQPCLVVPAPQCCTLSLTQEQWLSMMGKAYEPQQILPPFRVYPLGNLVTIIADDFHT